MSADDATAAAPAATIVTERDLRACVAIDVETVDVVASAFEALATRAVVMPPILGMELPDANGEVDVKTAYIPGFDGFAIKVSTGFFDNPKLGLASLGGLMMEFDARTGRVRAALLDNGYLTDVRTAAAGAVAARHLAPAEVTTVTVLGSGLQARLQLQAAHLVRPFQRAYVWGRRLEHARSCAADIAAATGAEAHATSDPGAAIAESQLVVTTTPARAPILRAEWLHPGLHVTAMGSDAPEKNELEPAALARAERYVCDRVTQCATRGELRSAIEAGVMSAQARPTELGEVVAGQADGRTSEAAVTVCDLTGTGAQDTVIAAHALERARARGAGSRIEI